MTDFFLMIYNFILTIAKFTYGTHPHPYNVYLIVLLYILVIVRFSFFEKPKYTTIEEEPKKEETCHQ